MRRKDREMPAEFGEQVADKCEWAVLSMIEEDGAPYCVPLTIVRDGNAIYFHTAKQGQKIHALRKNPKVCLACVGDTKRAAHEFTTEYESAIIRGIAEEVTEDAEKIRALRLLCERHTPTNMGAFDGAIAGSLFRTGVWKIQIQEISAKRKKLKQE
ncbi:pyridoxamine 5'-phosphate oxidase family protein [Hominifimenecus sp. rT4P-3]|uniref:pyridoxamine 5'-phosphate oxidase family protein n=1 Tax=Hominifimenecus sp. rT4P-3 TaxID=3242979 RepID=UPI003DA4B60C